MSRRFRIRVWSATRRRRRRRRRRRGISVLCFPGRRIIFSSLRRPSTSPVRPIEHVQQRGRVRSAHHRRGRRARGVSSIWRRRRTHFEGRRRRFYYFYDDDGFLLLHIFFLVFEQSTKKKGPPYLSFDEGARIRIPTTKKHTHAHARAHSKWHE